MTYGEMSGMWQGIHYLLMKTILRVRKKYSVYLKIRSIGILCSHCSVLNVFSSSQVTK